MERSTLARRAVTAKGATALLHYTIHGRQSEASTLSGPFSRKKGLEDPPECSFVHAYPCVTHRKHYKAAGRLNPMAFQITVFQLQDHCLHAQFPAGCNGVARVHDQVHHHLLHLPRIYADLAKRG